MLMRARIVYHRVIRHVVIQAFNTCIYLRKIGGTSARRREKKKSKQSTLLSICVNDNVIRASATFASSNISWAGMGFRNGRGGAGGGGKGGPRGPRKRNGSKKNKKSLLPQPAECTDADDARAGSSKRRAALLDGVLEDNKDDGRDTSGSEDEDEKEFGYREGLLEERKPFDGFVICTTGVSDQKTSLMEGARALGATALADMSEETTHLIADAPGSLKYNVSIAPLLQHDM